jgi:hypothetical protein
MLWQMSLLRTAAILMLLATLPGSAARDPDVYEFGPCGRVVVARVRTLPLSSREGRSYLHGSLNWVRAEKSPLAHAGRCLSNRVERRGLAGGIRDAEVPGHAARRDHSIQRWSFHPRFRAHGLWAFS